MSGEFEEIPLDRIPADQNDDDEEEGGTQEFKPGPTSTRYPEDEQTETPTLPHEESGLPNTSFDEDTRDLHQRLQQKRANSAWDGLTISYPNANKAALKTFYEKDKKGNPRLYVKMVGRNKPKYPLFTKSTVTQQLRENPKLPKEIKAYLGKSIYDQINDFKAEKKREISKNCKLNKSKNNKWKKCLQIETNFVKK